MKHGKARLKAINRIRPQLRDIAWRWDPIGLGQRTRQSADDEYDSVIDFVVGRVLASPASKDLPAETVAYILDDMEIETSIGGASKFVSGVQRLVLEAVE